MAAQQGCPITTVKGSYHGEMLFLEQNKNRDFVSKTASLTTSIVLHSMKPVRQVTCLRLLHVDGLQNWKKICFFLSLSIIGVYYFMAVL